MRRRTAAFVAAVLALSSVAACDASDPKPPPDPAILHADGTLRVLAGSELVDMDAILTDVKAATGVTVELSYIGTLAGVEQVISGAASKNFDAIWFATNQYLNHHPEANRRIVDAKPIMKSPVIVGVRAPVAAELGWDGPNRPSWKDIADKAAAGRLGFGMTNPATSNSGFSGLLSVTAGIAGTTPESLSSDQVRTARPEIRKFFDAQRLVSGSSGWLANAYASKAATETELNALINYESVLLSLNERAKSGELVPLTPIYPTDGAVVADYPLTLLADATEPERQRYNAVVSYLLQRKTQRDIMMKTHRRPSVTLPDESEQFTGGQNLAPRSVPEDPHVADAILSDFGSILRRPARTIYVLDLSGSMVENRIDPSNPNSVTRLTALQDALRGLTRADTSLSSQVLGFQEREQVVLLPFSTNVKSPKRFDLPADRKAAAIVLEQIKQEAGELEVGGATAVYDALVRAYQIAGEPAKGNPYTTIVLLSDGERTRGLFFDVKGTNDFVGRFPSLPATAEPRVPVFPILFGTAQEDEMKGLADLTGGLMFDARKKTSLIDVFKEIRGYQ